MNNELYHYGVPKMQWYHRRWQNKDGTYTEAGKKRYFGSKKKERSAINEYTSAKSEYKQAKKEYSKDFNKAYNKAIAAYSPFKKHRQANDERWKKADDSAEQVQNKLKRLKEAKAVLKDEKKAYKDEQKEERSQIKFEKSFSEGRNLSKNGASNFAIKANAAGMMMGNHIGNRLIKDYLHGHLESKGSTWVSNSGTMEIPLSKITDRMMDTGEILTNMYIYKKARQKSKALHTYEHRNDKLNKERFEKYKTRSERKYV